MENRWYLYFLQQVKKMFKPDLKKIKCKTNGCHNYVIESDKCPNCLLKFYKKPAVRKEKINFEKIYTKKSDISKELSILQRIWSLRFKEFCRENNLYYCWITGIGNNSRGIFSLHTSHYYPKSEYYDLFINPINCGLSTYDQNINKQYNIVSMRPKLAEVYGAENVMLLEKAASIIKVLKHRSYIDSSARILDVKNKIAYLKSKEFNFEKHLESEVKIIKALVEKYKNILS